MARRRGSTPWQLPPSRRRAGGYKGGVVRPPSRSPAEPPAAKSQRHSAPAAVPGTPPNPVAA
eukprot:10415108-Prorocentrum_lima.AAC.1